MELKNDIELRNTRIKLRELQAQYEEVENDQAETPRLRGITMSSLKRLINQLTEEILRYEAHHPSSKQLV